MSSLYKDRLLSESAPKCNIHHEYSCWLAAQQRQDAPAASDPIPVARVKPSASVCSPCFYMQRGAFGLSQKELKTKREEHETVAEKLPGHITVRFFPHLPGEGC